MGLLAQAPFDFPLDRLWFFSEQIARYLTKRFFNFVQILIIIQFLPDRAPTFSKNSHTQPLVCPPVLTH